MGVYTLHQFDKSIYVCVCEIVTYVRSMKIMHLLAADFFNDAGMLAAYIKTL